MNRIFKNTFILVAVSTLALLCACTQNIGSIDKEIDPTTSVDASSISFNETTEKLITDSIKSFYSAIEHQNSKELAKILDKNGIVFLRTFTSGFGTRGQEVYETISSSKIPEDLTFSFVQGEAPIKLKTEFKTSEEDILDIKVYDSDEGLNLDSFIKPDILNTFGKLIGNNKPLDEETRIYKLKGDSFCLAQFSGYGLQYSNWAVFEKKDKGYLLKIIAVIY